MFIWTRSNKLFPSQKSQVKQDHMHIEQSRGIESLEFCAKYTPLARIEQVGSCNPVQCQEKKNQHILCLSQNWLTPNHCSPLFHNWQKTVTPSLAVVASLSTHVLLHSNRKLLPRVFSFSSCYFCVLSYLAAVVRLMSY